MNQHNPMPEPGPMLANMEEDLVLKGPDAAIQLPDFRKTISVIDILFQAMKTIGESIAQIETDTGKSITFSELLEQSCLIAANLMKCGITEGDIVFLCSDKSILAFCLFVAVIFTGATLALKGTSLSKDDLRNLKTCQPNIILCSRETYKILMEEDVHAPIYIFLDGTSPQLNSNIFLKEGEQDFKIFKAGDLKNHFPLIMFTSGSTGPAKPVLVSNIAVQRYGYSYNPCNDNTKRFLVVGPIGWITTVANFISSIIKNYTLVLSVPGTVLMLERTQLYKVDTWLTPPATILALLNHPSLSNYDLSSLKTIIVGGAPLSMHLKESCIEKICRNNSSLYCMYGSTEVGSLNTWKDVDSEIIKKTSSCGKLASGSQLRVIAENGQMVGPGIKGEVRVKTDSMMTKYLGFPEATSRAFDSEGWFYTGDYGYYDENGFVYILSRLSDLVHYKGKRVCMAHIENLLLTHPAVYDAVVVARPNSIDKEHPAAFVVTKPNVNVTTEEIQRYIDDQVDDTYKLRGGVHIIESIPRMLGGKVIRYKLQERFNSY